MSTSRLQRYFGKRLSVHFSQFNIDENIRPDWLITDNGERLELDFYLPDIQVAIEIQGLQHYNYVPYFHNNYNGYLTALDRDKFKRSQCAKLNIKLFEIDNQLDADMVIQKLGEYFSSLNKKSVNDRIKIRLEALATIEKRIFNLSKGKKKIHKIRLDQLLIQKEKSLNGLEKVLKKAIRNR